MADNLSYGTTGTIASDERIIAGNAVHVQRVGEIGSATINHYQVNVSNVAVAVAATVATRKRLILVNRQTVPVYVGGSTVTTASGVRLDPGESLTLYTTGSVYGITAAASPANDRMHYIDESDW